MRPPPGADRPTRVAFAIVAVAARLVPSARRDDWRREWEGELWARASEGRRVVGPALGAFRHGAWLRRRDGAVRLGHIGRDLRYGARSLVRRPLFSISAIVTLALGLGATTAVWSIVDAVLLAPLPYPGGDRLVRVRAKHERFGEMTLSDELFAEWRERARGFEVLEMYVTTDAHLVGAGTPMIARRAMVGGGFLSRLLGVRPLAGRLFDATEASGDGPPVAVISESLWRSRFGMRADAIGALVRLNDAEATIIGVIPEVALLPGIDVWTPYRLHVDHGSTVLGGLRAIGRLERGVPLAQAAAWLAAAHAAQEHPESMGPFVPVLTDFRASLVKNVRMHLLLLLGAVAVVLALACVNVTGLLLARGAERSEEFAVRASLGAGRGHLVSQVMAEGVVLACAGGALGLLIAKASMAGILAMVPADMPLAPAVSLDRRVLAFACIATLGTALLIGIVPTLRATRAMRPLPAGRRGSRTRAQRRAGALLLGIEVAQAGALLVTAGLMVNTLVRMTTASSGFDPAGLLFVHLDLPRYGFETEADPTRRLAFMEELRARLLAIPGVRSVGIGSATPFTGMTFMTGVELEGGSRPGATDGGLNVNPLQEGIAVISRIQADAGYLETLGLPIVAGRALTAADADAPSPVAVINESAAKAYWPNESPLGRRVSEREGPWITIVGVVKDFGHPGLATKGMAEMYEPLTRDALASLERPTALVRIVGEPDATIERVRRAIWTIDPDLPIPAVGAAGTELGASLAQPRFYTLLLGIFAALALVLASVGIYGVVAGSVTARTKEIGIRLALGAPAARVGAMILREGMIVILTGLTAGLAAGAAASRLLRGLLYGIGPTDPATYAAVAAVLTTVAAIAVLIPARKAMRNDPVTSLKAE